MGIVLIGFLISGGLITLMELDYRNKDRVRNVINALTKTNNT